MADIKVIQGKVYRQGELIFIAVEGIGPNIKAKIKSELKDIGTCIREGEQSGHKHEVTGAGSPALLEMDRNDFWADSDTGSHETLSATLPRGQMFLTSDNQMIITHPEHKALSLPKGDYVIRIQREYDEAADMLVRD